jgi:ABC-type lipoprotein release transport system permease subunit
MIIKNIFLSEEKNIAILKAIGYKTKDICLIILSRVLILMICSYILNVLLCLILFQFNNYILLFVLINIFILVINSLIYYKKIKDMNVLLILNGD